MAEQQNSSPTQPLGMSTQRQKTLGTSLYWLNKYLASGSNEMEVHINTNYPTSLDDMTEEHLEEEHLILFLNSVGLWLASNQFMTRLHDWLGVKTKMEYYDGMKFVLKEKFPRHTYFVPHFNQSGLLISGKTSKSMLLVPGWRTMVS